MDGQGLAIIHESSRIIQYRILAGYCLVHVAIGELIVFWYLILKGGIFFGLGIDSAIGTFSVTIC